LSEEDSSLVLARARVGVILKDKWRLDSLLGVGGMAAVYSATHRNKNRVAVKMLHAQFSGQETVRTRFLREGYLANTVEHAGAVKVLDDDVAEDGAAFLVMELLEGETIEARWARKGNKLEVSEVLAIGDKLLDVLAAAHAKGVVHRDIKPENLFLTREGTLKVLDFGIARIFEGSQDPKGTRQGYIMGTPAFMAPEQALAKWSEVDGRTDVWAAGATMFTLLTGRHVHEGMTANEQLIKAATTPPPSLAAIDGNLPAPVVELVDKALAFDMAQRWSDALAMRQGLRKTYQAIRSGATTGRVPAAPQSDPRLGSSEGGAQPRPGPPRAAMASLPTLDSAAAAAQLAARVAERDARAAELASAMPAVNEATQRLSAARRKSAAIEQRILDARNERAALDEQFHKQTTSKTKDVGDARRHVNDAKLAFAKVAIDDTRAFGPEFDGTRAEVAKLMKATEGRARDVAIYEMALRTYNPESVRQGILVAAVAVAFVVMLFFVPFLIRPFLSAAPPPRPPPSAEPN
jgi:tRNA A-37 threonylcarbamoyl transferase component Bud32